MSRRSIAAIISLSTVLVGARVSAQTTRNEQLEDTKNAKATQLRPETRETGDVIVTKLENYFIPAPPAIRLTFGSFRADAGLAAGVSSTVAVGERGVWDSSAAWSVNNFKQVESSLSIPPLATDRVRLRALVKWDDAPDLNFFGIGPGSPPSELTYGLRSTEVSAELAGRAARWVRYGAGFGYLQANSSDGNDSIPSVGSLPPEQSAPGVGTSPEWWHSNVTAAIDSRTSPGYTASGGRYSVAFHDYKDRGGQYDFTRTEIDLRQFLPILHNNWIVALQARAELAAAPQGQVIPFFMLPTIGGRDSLPGFENYRFVDNDTLLLRSELRWTPSPLVDMAAFFDQGTVASSPGVLDLHDLKQGWGIGARFHGPAFTALRLEAAHSVEGWHYYAAQTVSF